MPVRWAEAGLALGLFGNLVRDASKVKVGFVLLYSVVVLLCSKCKDTHCSWPIWRVEDPCGLELMFLEFCCCSWAS